MSKLVGTLAISAIAGLVLFSTASYGGKINWDSEGKPHFKKEEPGKGCSKSCKQKSEFDFEDSNTSKGGN